MKGIILAGGLGTRFHPITICVSKQLLCVYDKPMIYYPLSTLLLAGIKDILIISTPDDLLNYRKLLGNGKKIGVKISYAKQSKPLGLAQAFIIGERFIGADDVCMILGDNIFHGNGLDKLMINAINNVTNLKKASVFGYYVNDPERYGVISFDNNDEIISIDEKPKIPNSNYAVVGLYFYPNSVVEISKQIKPSKRGELEITAINNFYLDKNNLLVEIMGTGLTWLDAGTPDSLLEASNYIQTIEKRQGLKVACLEQISYNKGYINHYDLKKIIEPMYENDYKKYLQKLLHQ